jgi:ABC-type nitrate/sulfonate/bicarbonate transport system substrate-binding protein
LKEVRIVGVPEHFNLPWLLALEEGAFADRGIELQWTNVPEGSGKMNQMLSEDKTDLAIILTEGIVKGIAAGNPSNIVQQYVESPLLWGIHVSASSSFTDLKHLEKKKAAISRFGSGSHLMSYVFAESMGWNTDSLEFHLVHTLEGAVEALNSAEADYFMWERFTTKPLVDRGIFRRLGDCPTPWPCFVVAARQDFIDSEPAVLQHILDIINLYTREFRHIPSIDRTLANRYEQDLSDIQEWLGLTRWSQSQINLQAIDKVILKLYNLKLIGNRISATDILTSL